MTQSLKIFSYLPNPRVWKAQIAGDLCGVNVSVLGDKPAQLGNWLWDANPRELTDADRTPDNPNARVSRRGFSGTLYKTDTFLQAHPFGTVPAAFFESADSQQTTGIFESNSILRLVVRASSDQHALYGNTHWEASRIDSFLDANLVFAREAQVYLLAMEDMSADTHKRMAGAYEFYLSGLESALAHSTHIAANHLTIADISFVCDFAQFLREGHYTKALDAKGLGLISARGKTDYPKTFNHLLTLANSDVFARRMGSYLDWYQRDSNT